MNWPETFLDFIFPRLTKWFLLRLALLACAAYFVFGSCFRFCIINGASMRPNFPAKGFTFCVSNPFRKTVPKRGEVVILKALDNQTMLLKRIVGLEGDVIEFRSGVLYVNNAPLEESWKTLGPCNWNLPPRTVEPGNIYVVGDNRSMDISEHVFGQLPASQIAGKPLF